MRGGLVLGLMLDDEVPNDSYDTDVLSRAAFELCGQAAANSSIPSSWSCSCPIKLKGRA